MSLQVRAWVIVLAGVAAAGCGIPPAQAAGTATPPTAATLRLTAPPPILYPPHDASATYPVIRTWTDVLEFEPYPYLNPLPAPEHTELDGVYAKFDTSKPQWWRCARCADFMLAGGNWRLMLHHGKMLLYYEVTGFSTVASYRVDDRRLELSNDPHCPYETGLYTWRLEDEGLRLTEVRDSCAIHLRAANLTHQLWKSCQLPKLEAAISDHWMKPPGCD